MVSVFLLLARLEKGTSEVRETCRGACFSARVRAGAVPAPGESRHSDRKQIPSPGFLYFMNFWQQFKLQHIFQQLLA